MRASLKMSIIKYILTIIKINYNNIKTKTELSALLNFTFDPVMHYQCFLICNRPHSGTQIIQMSLQLVNNPVARWRANVFHAAIPHLAYLWFWLRLMRAIRSIVCNPLWPSWPARTHLPPGATLVSGPLLTNTLSFIRKEPMSVP